jgi:2-polyprenyl-3-methyl-5-hydroxy-6-metoxy-1,4-benzoquinol methylase
MQQTPIHEAHNPDLLSFIPSTSMRLIEVGCSSGALAREFKKISPHCHYTGIEIDPDYAKLSERHCDESLVMDIESATDAFWRSTVQCDCWVFGDSLEHLKDPWRILRAIRQHMREDCVIVACIPNVQHWSVQMRLASGGFRYESSGLLDKTHLRWFTRATILEMFEDCGFSVVGYPRIFNHQPERELYLPLIKKMAEMAGVNPDVAVADALPIQYVVKAIPKKLSAN